MMAQPNDQAASDLCLSCGLCCDGTLFSKVRLAPEDNVDPLGTVGVQIVAGPDFTQPCGALESNCRCRVYADRPTQCRKFECRLLQSVSAGERPFPEAFQLIEAAKSQARLVHRGLQRLGNHAEKQALSLRYQETERRFRAGELGTLEDPDETAAAFADLTLAVYRLQAMLRRDFYATVS